MAADSCPAGYTYFTNFAGTSGCGYSADVAEALLNGTATVPAGSAPSTPAPPVTTPVTTPATTPATSSAPAASGAAAKPKDAIGFGFGENGGEGSTTFNQYCAEFPDDPICNIWYYGSAGTVTAGTGFGGGETVIVQNSGLNSVQVNDVVDASLTGLWDSAVSILDSVFLGFFGGILTALTSIGNALKNVFNVLSRLAGLILQALGALWNNVVKALVSAVKAVEALLKDLYDDVLKPLISGVQQMRQWLIDLYQKFLRPLTVWLQRLRQILAILKLFHIGFAGKLDSALADIQARITGPLLTLLGYVNGIANWINLIVTANYLLQKPLFLASLNAYKGEALNLQLNAMTQPISAAASAAIAKQQSFPPAAQSVTDLNTILATSTGPIVTSYTNYDAVFQAALQGQIQEPPS